jgi:hypothetical protein
MTLAFSKPTCSIRAPMSSAIDVQRAVDVVRAPMDLQIDDDYTPAFREQRQHLAEHLDRADAAV